MANIKTPDGGFYLDDTEFNVDYTTNLVTLSGTSPISPTGDYLSVNGGEMNGNIDMNGHNISNIHGMSFVGQDNFVDCETSVVFLSTNENDLSTAFAIVNGNTDTDAIFQSGIMYKDDYFNGTLVINNNLNTFDGTTSYFGKQGDGHLSNTYFDTFEGLTVDSNGVVTIKSNSPISFNNGIITNVANPVNNTDVVNKQYADATYASVSSVPTNATTSQAGIVKQISNIAQLEASTATTEQIATTVNSLLTALQDAGIMSAT